MSKKTTFGKFENRLARRIGTYCRKYGRSPQKWEIIRFDSVNDPKSVMRNGKNIFHHGLTNRRAFTNLVSLGLVEHSRNGHCWLTDAGKKKLGLKL